ncbi:MAG: CdaR family protein [Acidobacteriota bacterium]
MRRLLLHNLGWKLFSLVVSVVLWFTFVGSPDLVNYVSAPMRLSFERRASREVRVKVQTAQRPPQGYRLRSLEAAPARLAIVGPESRVREVEFVETDPIDLSQALSQQEFRTNVFVRDPLVRLASPAVVTVRLTLEKSSADTGLDGETTVRD